MNTRIALSLFSIFAVLALVGGATYAFFFDSNTSTGNLFATGNLILELDDVDETSTSNTISSSIGTGSSAFMPGSSVSGFISLHNAGSVPMAEVEFGANRTAHDGDGDLLEDVVDLTVMTGTNSTCSGGTDQTTAIAIAITDNALPLTLAELIATDYDALPGLAADTNPGDEYFVCMTATMRSTAGNEFQGDNVTVDFVFTGNQDSSQ